MLQAPLAAGAYNVAEDRRLGASRCLDHREEYAIQLCRLLLFDDDLTSASPLVSIVAAWSVVTQSATGRLPRLP